MKKIIIVNDNLHLGGIQKSLTNLLKTIHNDYDITLLLLNKHGELLSEIPHNVTVISACKSINVLGAYKKELKTNLIGYIWKGILLIIAKKISKKVSFNFAGFFQKKLGKYDVAISYSHPSKDHDLRSCSAEVVLEKVVASKKICFVHADYQNESNRCAYTDLIYKAFDKITCCSESVKQHFIDALPDVEKKTCVVRNFYDLSIATNKKIYFYNYDETYINVVSVARLTSEKGIKRAVKALYESKRKDIRYYIIGEGSERKDVERMILQYKLCEQIFLMGESKQPYVYMKNADYLLVPSYHEAAPMVYDEAKLLGLQIITTNTTSALEMVGTKYGIVCENSTEGIRDTLIGLKKEISSHKEVFNNHIQKKQFADLLNG